MKEELWAWHDYTKDQYRMVYANRKLVEMCSPDYFKGATERGEGRIVKLKVVEVTEE